MDVLKNLSHQQYIDGEWVDSSNKATRDIINPYNQEVIFKLRKGQLKILNALFLQHVAHLNQVSGRMKLLRNVVRKYAQLLIKSKNIVKSLHN